MGARTKGCGIFVLVTPSLYLAKQITGRLNIDLHPQRDGNLAAYRSPETKGINASSRPQTTSVGAFIWGEFSIQPLVGQMRIGQKAVDRIAGIPPDLRKEGTQALIV